MHFSHDSGIMADKPTSGRTSFHSFVVQAAGMLRTADQRGEDCDTAGK
jgi:hypothetical protein